MSIRDYNYMKDRFETTKPIRGRSEDVRPIGERRRDWERVVQDGDKYGARLYDTNCVMYHPNGDFELTTGGWDTPTTTAFISQYTPYRVRCFKRYSKVWVEIGDNAYPVPRSGTLRLNFVKEGEYVPAEVPKVMQRVVDRTKSRDVRKTVEPFRNYCRNMLKLSDGWLSHDLVKQFEVASEHAWMNKSITFREKVFVSWSLRGGLSSDTAEELYQFMATATEEEYPNLLVLIAKATNYQDSRLIHQYTTEHTTSDGQKYHREHQTHEYCYRPQSVVTRIDYICQTANDVSKLVEAEVGKVVTNAV